MTTNILYTQDKLTTLANYLSTNPYVDSSNNATVSVSDDYTYEKTCADVHYSISNDKFKDFLINEIFKVSYKNGDLVKEVVSNNYLEGITFYSNSGEVDYTKVKQYYKIKDNGENKEHSAGTLFTSEINKGENTSFNVGILFDRVINDNSETISKVNIELKSKEPLMQSIVDCNGKVYDFKKGVKLSDFAKFIEKKKEGTPVGYVDFNSIAPTNLSINSDNSVTNSDGTSISKIYELVEFNDNIQDISSINESIGTIFSGYIIFCSFNKDPNSEENSQKSLLECKPYITIIRCILNTITFDFNSIIDKFTLIVNTSTRDYINDTLIYTIPHYNQSKETSFDNELINTES